MASAGCPGPSGAPSAGSETPGRRPRRGRRTCAPRAPSRRPPRRCSRGGAAAGRGRSRRPGAGVGVDPLREVSLEPPPGLAALGPGLDLVHADAVAREQVAARSGSSTRRSPRSRSRRGHPSAGCGAAPSGRRMRRAAGAATRAPRRRLSRSGPRRGRRRRACPARRRRPPRPRARRGRPPGSRRHAAAWPSSPAGTRPTGSGFEPGARAPSDRDRRARRGPRRAGSPAASLRLTQGASTAARLGFALLRLTERRSATSTSACRLAAARARRRSRAASIRSSTARSGGASAPSITVTISAPSASAATVSIRVDPAPPQATSSPPANPTESPRTKRPSASSRAAGATAPTRIARQAVAQALGVVLRPGAGVELDQRREPGLLELGRDDDHGPARLRRQPRRLLGGHDHVAGVRQHERPRRRRRPRSPRAGPGSTG